MSNILNSGIKKLSDKNFNLEPFSFLKVKLFLKKNFHLIFFITVLFSIFILILLVSKNTMSNQEIFNVLEGKRQGVFLTKSCIKINEKDDKLIYRISEYLKNSDYYSGNSVANIVFLNFPHILDKHNDKDSITARKQVFIKAILPLIVAANQEVLKDRQKVLYLSGRMPKDELSDKDIEIFTYLINKYDVQVKINTPWDVIAGINALVVKVNVIPNSLILALAIMETDWGKSKLLKEKNSLFSERVLNANINHLENSKKTKNDNSIKRFNTLNDSVNSFFFKLNSSSQYKDFRDLRFKQLNYKRGVDVYSLTNPLSKNRESNYALSLKNIIKEYKLTMYDKYDSIKENKSLCLYFQ